MSDESPAERERLDKWLWRARFFKTRAIAAAAVSRGKVRVNGARQTKPGAGLKLGDALTIACPGGVHVVLVQSFGVRRGPAAEARALYTDLDETSRKGPTDRGQTDKGQTDDASPSQEQSPPGGGSRSDPPDPES